MASFASTALPRWGIATPLFACIVLAVAWSVTPSWPVLLLVSVSLIAAVIAAVHHAEVVAHRVGEPFGTLVLAIAVTVIEVALIVSLMLASASTSRAGTPMSRSLDDPSAPEGIPAFERNPA